MTAEHQNVCCVSEFNVELAGQCPGRIRVDAQHATLGVETVAGANGVDYSRMLQVSRRLMRRIKATVRQPGNNLGFVKVAVHAYVYMLVKSSDETSSYSPSFFAREVVSGSDAVVSFSLRSDKRLFCCQGVKQHDSAPCDLTR